MTDVDENMKISLKPPRFSGTKADWEYYKIAMKSYLSVSGLGEILSYEGEVPSDNAEVQAQEFQDAVGEQQEGAVDNQQNENQQEQNDAAVEVPGLTEEQVRIRKKNKKAAGILFASIVNSTTDGKKAISIIKPHFSNDDITPGHFPKAWNALTHWFEVVKKKNKEELRKTFYDMKMSTSEQPSEFIMKIEETRDELKKCGYEIANKEFAEVILKALPLDDRGVGAYSIVKSEFENKNEASDEGIRTSRCH